MDVTAMIGSMWEDDNEFAEEAAASSPKHRQ
jgi:hypothetical protein